MFSVLTVVKWNCTPFTAYRQQKLRIAITLAAALSADEKLKQFFRAVYITLFSNKHFMSASWEISTAKCVNFILH